MIDKISVSTMGGLGNTLFQIAAAYSISLRDKLELIVDSTNHHGAHHNINKYKDNIFRNINFSESVVPFKSYGEPEFKYRPIPEFQENTKLVGYFQSEKYFKEYSYEIKNLFFPKPEIFQKLNSLYGELFTFDSLTTIHVRRGDYLSLPTHHPVLPIDYYQKAISLLNENQIFLIFSDDLDWCRNNFDFIENKVFVDDLEDYEELYLMSRCNNNIIANSSFSWWGAWLNDYQNKIVISPEKWFGPSLDFHNTEDIYCEGWIKI